MVILIPFYYSRIEGFFITLTPCVPLSLKGEGGGFSKKRG